MRRKRDGWAQMVARWTSSGESAGKFARRAGTTAATLYRWRRALGRVKPARVPGVSLARIVEVRGGGVADDDRFEVRLAGGRSVAVPPSFDPDALGRLLRALEAAR